MQSQIAGYDVVEQLSRGAYSHVYRAVHPENGHRVVIKTSASDYASESDVTRLRQEFELLNSVRHPGVVRALALVAYGNGLALVIEQAPGEPLSRLIDGKPMGLRDFLTLAVGVSESLAAVHDADLIHRDINPSNIVVHMGTLTTWLVDFNIATYLPRESVATRNPDAIAGTLPYIAPEQTGRLNRAVDHRADLYSLGATFYEMLTGAPPFLALDPLELIHHHIARVPSAPSRINSNVPEALSNLVLRLLAKSPEERYQSAAGVKSDLERCRVAVEAGEAVPDFPLGQQDFSIRFRIPDTLYGREKEMRTVLDTFDGAANRPTLLLIAGYAGVGKSRLVSELQAEIANRNGFFIAGKFDQLKRNVPFASVHEAFRELIRQLLSESQESIAEWRQNLLEALGNNGQLVVDVIPELEIIIGSQTPVEPLPPRESQHRFQSVFRAFVESFCRREHPVCLFLDDLQWVDPATLSWLETTLAQSEGVALFLIGAYRDNEVTAAHPLTVTLDRLARNGARIERLSLLPLPQKVIAGFIADALRTSVEQSHDLANIVFDKTQGNPFFVNQLLLSLYEDGILRFSRERLRWEYALDQVEAKGISANVVDLLLERIRRLEDAPRETLKTAACVGSRFSGALLGRIAGVDSLTIALHLADAVRLGLLTMPRESESYHFRHDRVQQAVLTLFRASEAERTHLKIGRLLVSEMRDAETDDDLFNALSHFEAAPCLVEEAGERSELARLNLVAAQRARRSTAYEQALNHAHLAVQFLEEGNRYRGAPAFEATLERALCEHLAGQEEAAALSFEGALALASTTLDKARTLESQIHFLTDRADFRGAYARGRQGAALFGIFLPEAFVPPKFLCDFIRVKLRTRGKQALDLADLPDMVGEENRIGARIATGALKAAYQIRPELCVAGSAAIVQMCLERGNFPECPVAYLPVGPIFQSGVLGRHKAGHEWGQLCLALLEKSGSSQQRAEVNFVYGYFAHSWMNPLVTTEEYYRTAYRSGVETGDLFHAGCACSGIAQNMHMRGADLDAVLAECDRFLPFLHRSGSGENVGTLHAVRQTIRSLRGETESPTSFADAQFDEEAYVRSLSDYGSPHFAHYYYVNKLQALYLWREYDAAVEIAATSATYLKSSIGMQHMVEHHFYTALLSAELYASGKAGPRSKWLRVVRRNARRFRAWAAHCPANYLHKAQLLEAEVARITGNTQRAALRYDEAIAGAEAHGFKQNSALANDLAGRFYTGLGRAQTARFYFREAAYGYRRWGARSIAQFLESRYAIALPEESASPSVATRHTSLDAGRLLESGLEIGTVVKAAQAVAREVRLSDLLSQLTQIVMANAGADRAVILLPHGGELVVQSEGTVGGVQVMQAIPLSAFPEIAVTLVNYVVRTREPVVLGDAHQAGPFRLDPHLRSSGVRSVLCAPLLSRGALAGVLYLENSLTADAFTPDRTELLQLLSGQFAISIENSLAYGMLEEKVRERTVQLEARNALIRQIFGRYISVDVVERLLQDPSGLIMGGEERNVTVLICDLRGFTALVSSLRPDQVVTLTNNYLGVMTDVIMEYGGNVNGFAGDGIVAIFGAPVDMPDHALRGTTCALAMQLAIDHVNALNRNGGLPEVAMGIGLSTGEAIAGNLGSMQRSTYSVIGTIVNLAARIEGFSTAGQVLVSERTLAEAGAEVVVRGERTVEAKGIRGKIKVYDVAAVAGKYALALPTRTTELRLLCPPQQIRYALLTSKQVSEHVLPATITHLSELEARLVVQEDLEDLTNLALLVPNDSSPNGIAQVFAKVMSKGSEELRSYLVRFTSVPAEARQYFAELSKD